MPAHGYILIREKLFFYEVEERSPWSYSSFRIGKLLGIVWTSVHESLVADPDWVEEQSKIEEIR